MPGISSWAEWCYAQPSRLLFGGEVINSASGVQQGDNLGPLLFALALHPTLERIKGIHGLDIVVGYLDDVFLAGEAPAVKAALEIIDSQAAALGLRLNRDKCKLIPTAGPTSTVDLELFPAEIGRVRDGNFTLLGSPIGTKQHCVSFTQTRVGEAKKLLELTTLLEDQQITHKLLCSVWDLVASCIPCVRPGHIGSANKQPRPTMIS